MAAKVKEVLNDQLDEVDAKIVSEFGYDWLAAYNIDPSVIHVGYWVKLYNGAMERVSLLNNNGMMQITQQAAKSGSFFMHGDGRTATFGGLHHLQLFHCKRFIPTGKWKTGEFWMFHHGEVGADRRVNFTLECPVFEIEVPS